MPTDLWSRLIFASHLELNSCVIIVIFTKNNLNCRLRVTVTYWKLCFYSSPKDLKNFYYFSSVIERGNNYVQCHFLVRLTVTIAMQKASRKKGRRSRPTILFRGESVQLAGQQRRKSERRTGPQSFSACVVYKRNTVVSPLETGNSAREVGDDVTLFNGFYGPWSSRTAKNNISRP